MVAVVDDPHEVLHHLGIELRPRGPVELGEGLPLGAGLTVGPGRDHGEEAVDDGQDARADGDGPPPQTLGVAAAVVPLVMMEHDLLDTLGQPHALDELQRPMAMVVEVELLLGREVVLLGQEKLGDPDLADVVEEGGEADVSGRPLRQAHPPAHLEGHDSLLSLVGPERGHHAPKHLGEAQDEVAGEVVDLGVLVEVLGQGRLTPDRPLDDRGELGSVEDEVGGAEAHDVLAVADAGEALEDDHGEGGVALEELSLQLESREAGQPPLRE